MMALGSLFSENGSDRFSPYTCWIWGKTKELILNLSKKVCFTLLVFSKRTST